MLPQDVLDSFAYAPTDTTNENDYSGAYNKLIFTAFFLDPYKMVPFYPLTDDYPAPKKVTLVVLTMQWQPLLFLQFHFPDHVNLLSTRIAVDNKTRQIFRSLCPTAVTPKLHGVSAMGQKFAFYSMETSSGRVFPDRVPTAGDSPEVDTVPANRWEFDITTDAGHRQFMAVVNDIKGMDARTH
ncbi:hypothetical protein DEU56DRAFT_242352 [Suillus clintonianus]|uniref:uncharacterized protein n=1 Tax=Suillus clintonianus TaxID=1904413 RepID=UPI001B86B02C|nr:uncharacterized protein DEU56DRAFT_242352 [Suillus clintonianus]KAG2143579.1 hypothetical protein DEU56DRAFT_242352 [Suillus clintonianus]